jgi:hypothetical protein
MDQVGSAYALSSTAFIPLSGNLADAFGRFNSPHPDFFQQPDFFHKKTHYPR